MWYIIEGLHLGTREDSEDSMLLNGGRVSHIVNCAAELPCLFDCQFEYLHLSLQDPDDRLHSKLDAALAFIDRGREQGAVLVHCSGGVSRSPAVILAYLCHIGLGLTEAGQSIRNAVQARPNEVFVRQVCNHFGLEVTNEEIAALIFMLSNSQQNGING